MLAVTSLPKPEVGKAGAYSTGLPRKMHLGFQKGKARASVCCWNCWEFILQLWQPAGMDQSQEGIQLVWKPEICLQEPTLWLHRVKGLKQNI